MSKVLSYLEKIEQTVKEMSKEKAIDYIKYLREDDQYFTEDMYQILEEGLLR